MTCVLTYIAQALSLCTYHIAQALSLRTYLHRPDPLTMHLLTYIAQALSLCTYLLTGIRQQHLQRVHRAGFRLAVAVRDA